MIRALMLVCALMLATPAFAQTAPVPGANAPVTAPVTPDPGPPLLMLTRGKPTHPERLVMLWYKMVGQTPDFMAWAKKSPFLKKAHADDYDTIVNNETNRLQQEWNEFDPTDMINVQVRINLNRYSTLQEMLTLNEFTPSTFFSFMMYDINVAIVPQGIAEFHKMKKSKAEMNTMLEKAGGGQVTAEILLKPIQADSKTPFRHNKLSYWLILGKIQEMRFWSTANNQDTLLWMHRADDYHPAEDKSLLDLKAGAQ